MLALSTETLGPGDSSCILYGPKVDYWKNALFHLGHTVAAPETFFKIIKGLVPPSPCSGGVLDDESGQISCYSGEIFRIQ